MSVNFGYSDRLGYDQNAYSDKIKESVSPLMYRIDDNYAVSNKACLSLFGPRPNRFSDVSKTCDCRILPHPDITDMESILSNRNIPLSKARVGKFNNININNVKLNHMNTCHSGVCTEFLNEEPSRLVYPAATYRELSVNRFIDLPRNAQEPIFYDFQKLSRLESKDNYAVKLRQPMIDRSLPIPIDGKAKECRFKCDVCA